MEEPDFMVAAREAQALGWGNFAPELMVRCIAIPVTLHLLEVLVVGYFVLRVTAVVKCETVPGDAASYQCAASVLHRGPVVAFFCIMGLILARAILPDLLVELRRMSEEVPGVHTRVLLNRA
jgi:hypothetical protein